MLIFELSERSSGKFSLKLEMLLSCSKANGEAGPYPTFVQRVGWGLPHHKTLEIYEKKVMYPRNLNFQSK
jgi:hypothetical protein